MLRWLIVFTLTAAPASAETSAVDLQAWLCRLAPKAQRCRVPIPPAKPIELPSQPKPPAVPQRQPPVASQSAPTVKPPPQQVAPRAAQGRQNGKPQWRQQQSKPKIEQQPLSGGGQQLPQVEGGFCFFPISCAQVCEYARAGDSRRGTSCQNARGLACVRSTCPEVLKKKR